VPSSLKIATYLTADPPAVRYGAQLVLKYCSGGFCTSANPTEAEEDYLTRKIAGESKIINVR